MKYEISTYVAGDTLFIQRNLVGNRADRKPIASCRHDRFCLAIGEAILRHLETGVAARLVDAINSRPTTRRRMTLTERAKVEERIRELVASEQELNQFIAEANALTRSGLESMLKNTRKQLASLRAELATDAQPERTVEPYTEVDVTNLFRSLAHLMEAGTVSDDFRQLTTVRVVRIEPLRVIFEAHVRLPLEAYTCVELGPIPFSAERTTRLPAGKRATAMAELCFDRAWPTGVVAPGVPFVCPGYTREKIATEISRILRRRIGPKAAGMVAWSQVPEVVGVISRHLGLGKPGVEIPEDLEERIVATYIHAEPRGPKAWPQFSDDHELLPVFRQVREEGEAPATGVSSRSYWCREGWLQRRGSRFLRQTCQWCGSVDLAIVAVPEVHGLMCLGCRRDGSGLAFPLSWNAGTLDQEYWRAHNYELLVPDPDGLPEYVFEVLPITLR